MLKRYYCEYVENGKKKCEIILGLSAYNIGVYLKATKENVSYISITLIER